jgi:hypothetical protein
MKIFLALNFIKNGFTLPLGSPLTFSLTICAGLPVLRL